MSDTGTAHLKRVEYADGKGFISPIEEILEDFRNGRMIILTDAEDRENEGDLVIPAQMATPEAINFMAKHGRGLICLSLPEERANALNLEFMTRKNEARNRTAFTVSIEAREGIATGISAHDRAHTIRTAIDLSKGAHDIVSPGHVFPLVAREGGVLVRAGHTEASVDLARLAGLYPSGVICEIMNDDGTMARMPDLVAFAQRHGLKIGTIEDMIAYRLKNDRIVKQTSTAKVDSTFGGVFDLNTYVTMVEDVEHLALVKGDLTTPGPVLVRVHAVSVHAELHEAPVELGLYHDHPAATWSIDCVFVPMYDTTVAHDRRNESLSENPSIHSGTESVDGAQTIFRLGSGNYQSHANGIRVLLAR